MDFQVSGLVFTEGTRALPATVLRARQVGPGPPSMGKSGGGLRKGRLRRKGRKPELVRTARNYRNNSSPVDKAGPAWAVLLLKVDSACKIPDPVLGTCGLSKLSQHLYH